MDKNRVSKLTAFYDQDSKRFHRYIIDANEDGIVGNIYVPKGKDQVPKKLEVTMEVPALTEERDEEKA